METLSFLNLAEMFVAFAINFIQAMGRLVLETLAFAIWIQTMMMPMMEQRENNKMPKLLKLQE
jgi:hypothetical protein